MPISVILLGVFIIAINFKLTSRVFSQLGISLMLLDLISIMAFILIIVTPINFFDIFYVSLGGFFVLVSLGIYLLFTVKHKKQFYTIAVSFISLIGTSFLLDILFPYMDEQIFNYTTVIVGLVSGLSVYFSCKNLKNAYIVLFLTTPIISLINYLINAANNTGAMLFLGVGNLFEVSVIAFAVVYLIITLKTSSLFRKNKESDILILTNEEVFKIKKEGEIDENKNNF
jgi:hypothetical protein